MKSKQTEIVELEAELLRLNNLVRARRVQLEKLEKCPNKDCECRQVWRDVVETNLAKQVGKIRGHVRNGSSRKSSPKTATQKKRAVRR